MKDTQSNLTYGDPSSWAATIWKALHAYREDLIPEGDEMFDDQWSEITTAMAWIEEEINTSSNSISISWNTEDVIEQAKPEKLTEDEAWEVLQATEHRHDASIGINWDVLQCHIDDLVQARERAAVDK